MRRVLAVLAGAVAAMTLAASPAAAHDEIVGTTPPDGATLATAPDRVVLTFAEPAIALGTQVQVTGPDGAVLSQGSATLDGVTVVQALAPSRPAGGYRVEWRVTSADGHPVTGSFTFTATSATTGAGAATISTAAAPTAPTANAGSAAPTGAAPGSSAAATRAPTTPSPSSSVLAVPPAQTGATTAASSTRPAVLAGIVALVVLALVVVRLGRARSLRRLAAAQDAGTHTPRSEDAGPPGAA